MTELKFIVDEQKCIKCGLCVKECIVNAICIDEETKIPKTKNPERCLSCQHCFSTCPTGAITLNDKKAEDSDQIYMQNPEMILNLIKSRRSIRQFKNENVSNDKMKKLKDMLKWIPTGCNYHDLQFSFIDDIEVMNEFRDYTNQKIIKAVNIKPIKAVVDKFAPMVNALTRGNDIIFRGAPHMIVVSNSVKAPCSSQDGIIALSYFELYAQSLGLGTCWCGFANTAMMLFPELCEYLEVPEGHQVVYAMLFGEKDINYARTTQPDDYKIISAKKTGFENIKTTKKLKRYFWNFLR